LDDDRRPAVEERIKGNASCVVVVCSRCDYSTGDDAFQLGGHVHLIHKGPVR